MELTPEDKLGDLRARIAVMERMIGLLIATHPEPHVLVDAWRATAEGLGGRFEGSGPSTELQSYKRAGQELMANFGALIDRISARPAKGRSRRPN